MTNFFQDLTRKINVQYYALLREERGLSSEALETISLTPKALYEELSKRHRFTLKAEQLSVSVNNAFAAWDTKLKAHDTVVFIPPVAGG